MAVVTNVTSFGRSGLSDFVIQRVSAVVIALYAFLIAGFFVANPHPDRAALLAFFSGVAMRMFSTLAVLATAAHAWIGMWTIGTDYVRPHYFGRHATVFRITYQFGCLLLLFVYVLWGLAIFWSI
jgi:succinate dehydrogenase / fumarate reductase membrane anchor subunit